MTVEEKLVEMVNDLAVELAEFRAEMKEFKKSVGDDVSLLSKNQFACQLNPAVCSTARKLDDHIKGDGSRVNKVCSLVACGVSVLSFLLVIVSRIFDN